MKMTRFFSGFFTLILVLTLSMPFSMTVRAENTIDEAANVEVVTAADDVSTAEDITPSLLPDDPDIQAKAALLIDLNRDGKLVYGKNEHERLYPASLTKIMTALLVLEAVDNGELSLDTPVTASEIVWSMPAGSSTAGIKAGETMSVRNMLYCLLVSSANEAADILAEEVSGTVTGFVQAMNAKATELGCENTHFTNTHGFHDEYHYTSAWDIALITREAMKHPAFMTICDTDRYIVPATNMNGERTLLSTNHLISLWRNRSFKNPEVHGVKTGSTSEAGYCLVSTAERGSLHFMSVVMGAEGVDADGKQTYRSFTETTRLFNWGFDHFRYASIIEEGEPVWEVPVELSWTDHVTVIAGQSAQALLPVKLTSDQLERTIRLDTDHLSAPIQAGEKLGVVELGYRGVNYGTVDIIASHDVELSRIKSAQKTIADLAQKTSVRIGVGLGAAAIIGGAAFVTISRGRRNRYGKNSGGSSNGYRGRR